MNYLNRNQYACIFQRFHFIPRDELNKPYNRLSRCKALWEMSIEEAEDTLHYVVGIPEAIELINWWLKLPQETREIFKLMERIKAL